MRHLSFLISLVLCLLLVPAYGLAQDGDEVAGNVENVEIQNDQAAEVQEDQAVEDANMEAETEVQEVKLPRTIQDNFRGGFFGAEILLGSSQTYDGDIGEGRDAYDNDAKWGFAGNLKVELGYLWGKEVFIGPMIAVSAGFPELVSTDIRIKFVVPFRDKDALNLQLGWGASWVYFMESDKPVVVKRPRKNDESDHSLSWFELRMYLPVQIGYEHVFDNGFVLGASIEARINFGKKEIFFDYDEANKDKVVYQYNRKGEEEKYSGVKQSPSIYYGMITAGIHLGYKF